jgi:membrane protein required for colicin V production
MGLTGLDIAVMLVVGLAAMAGFSRGFTTEVTSLAAWVVAIFAVKLLHTPVSLMLVGPVGTDTGAAVLAFALVFGAAFALVKMAARRMGRATKASVLGPIDRLLGFGFGGLKGLIAASLAFLFFTLVHDTLHGAGSVRPAWMTKSRTYPLLRASSDALVDFVERRRAA